MKTEGTVMTIKNKSSIASVVLGVVGTAFSVIFPVVSYACCIPGLIFAIRDKKRTYKRAKAGIALNIVGLSIAFINSALAVSVAAKVWLDDKKSALKD